MEPLSVIYWIKFGLGVFAATLCVVLNITNIFSGIVLCIAVYLVSDRILRQIFITKVSKPSSITRTGIEIYFTSWIFFWILLYTLFS